jgi:glycolate oxidase FAD binding subunit
MRLDPDHLLNPGKVFPKLRRFASPAAWWCITTSCRFPTFHGSKSWRARSSRATKGLRQAVEWALADNVTLDVRGQGSKLALANRCTAISARPLGHAKRTDTPRRSWWSPCAPAPLRDVEALAQRNQMLAFDARSRPAAGLEAGGARWLAADGQPAGSPSVGGCRARSPAGLQRRQRPREAFKSAAGDEERHRLRPPNLAGSWGTLAILDEVSVKVLPAPDQTRTDAARP